ncbi:hypothetical protein ACVFYP_24030 [Roseomonas sp. F4]
MPDRVITLREAAGGFLLIPASAWRSDAAVRQPGISRGVGLLTLEAALMRALQEGSGTRAALLDLVAELRGSPFFVTGPSLSDREVIATITRGVQDRRVLVMRFAHLPGAREIEGEPLAMLRALDVPATHQRPPDINQNIAGLPMRERWLIVLGQVPDHLSMAGMGEEMKGRVRDFFSPESLAMLAATMAVMMMNPAGILALLAGGLMLGITLLFAKDAILEGIAKLSEVFDRVESAKTKADLDAAAAMLAAAVTMIGVELFIKIIARAGPKRRRGGDFAVVEKPVGGPPKPSKAAPEQHSRLPGPRQIQRTPSSGVPIVADPNKTTTVLGNYHADVKHVIEELNIPKNEDFGPKKGGFNVLNVPDEKYKNPEQFWKEYNKPFLDEAIARGDRIPMATRPPPPGPDRLMPDGSSVRSGFGREYDYLVEQGYRYDPVSSEMVR